MVADVALYYTTYSTMYGHTMSSTVTQNTRDDVILNDIIQEVADMQSYINEA